MALLSAFLLASLLTASAENPRGTQKSIPPGKPLVLAEQRVPERATVFVFFRASSSLEQSFVRELREQAGVKVGFREIPLKTGVEPLAQQYAVTGTPTVLVYDRRGRLVGRSGAAPEIEALVAKAAQVMRIDWAEPGDPRHAEMDQILGRSGSVGIMRTMSLRPDWLRQMRELKRLQNQPDTALDAHTKDLIAAYVSALNKCKY